MSLFNTPNQQTTYRIDGYPSIPQPQQTPYQPPVVNQPQYQPPQPQQQVVTPVPGQMIQGQQMRKPSMKISVYRKGAPNPKGSTYGQVGKELSSYTELVGIIQVGDKVYFGSQHCVNHRLSWVAGVLGAKGLAIHCSQYQNSRYGSITYYIKKAK
jgi:hypothetical protein